MGLDLNGGRFAAKRLGSGPVGITLRASLAVEAVSEINREYRRIRAEYTAARALKGALCWRLAMNSPISEQGSYGGGTGNFWRRTGNCSARSTI